MRPLPQILADIDSVAHPVSCLATDYPADALIPRHAHAKHQLVYAVRGVMVVQTAAGLWIVPPNRAIWMPAGTEHATRCIGAVQMRSVYVRPTSARRLPRQSQVVNVSPLLRELIQAAFSVQLPYAKNSRDERLMRLLLDELHALPTLPLHLPQPADPRLCVIAEHLRRQPGDPATLAAWAAQLGIDVKTVQRLFYRETGMTFGQWRTQVRLLRALERLATGAKIIDVALELGYDSPSAFATMFKRQFGQTPSQFFK